MIEAIHVDIVITKENSKMKVTQNGQFTDIKELNSEEVSVILAALMRYEETQSQTLATMANGKLDCNNSGTYPIRKYHMEIGIVVCRTIVAVVDPKIRLME